MSFKGSNIQDGNSLSNPEIKSILLNIYDRLTKPSTKEVGYELFLKLILNNLYSTSSISFILSQLSEFIPPLPPKEKEPCLKLLSLIFFDPIQNTQSSPDNRKNTIYYQDKEYGKVRILAADKSLPFGTIIRINNLNISNEPIIGIVLDRGSAIGFNKNAYFDLLYRSEKESSYFGRQKATFEVLRKGY